MLFPSGDPTADRRAGYAETMAHLGDMDAAIQVLGIALDLSPDWAAGWFRLGEFHDLVGETDVAVEMWRRAEALDPSDPFGAGLRCDLTRAVPVSETMPPAFVELLFDQYASRFESSLVGKLEYCGPEEIMLALDAAGFHNAARALDLGCGTGLLGERLRPFCRWLEGYDLSAGMLGEAEAKGLYDRLGKRDIGALEIVGAPFDLIVAADVFAYLGALERVVAWCAGMLVPGGRFAFTVEQGTEGVTLRESQRFAHGRDYIEDILQEAGFGAIRIADCVVRMDRGAPVASLCVVADLSSTTRDAGEEERAVLLA
ncbi:MAG: methyltransferase type 12 [Maritimibacter sp.]|nr:methyltransferase type 12 [Maritimibacter sp.]|tara:strand:- start:579 stop:1520 length:942 start_codon:yes stop_codon:yes gene_type:complete